ncbi:MAG: hypothetical protein QM758_25565 [Armatimonas sp.]
MTTKLALLAMVGGVLLAPTTARAQIYDDDTTPLAPPVRNSGSSYSDGFDWRDISYGERVEISRAAFDQDGYLLFDRRGQTISVPFEGNNLYVMRFGQTSGRTFFVNDGGVPTLYLPADGYLENLAASGARWYPFPQQFNYTRPIYIGLAPSWNDYVSMGWYPGMTYWGGYWDYNPWHVGYRYAPMSSWSIRIGSFSYTRWGDYCDYWRVTPARRIVFIDRPSRIVYRDRGRDWDRRDRYPSYSRNEPQKDRIVRPGNGNNDRFDRGRFDNNNRNDDRFDRSRFGSSSRDRESGRTGDDSRFSRSGGFSRDSDSRFGSSGSSRDDRFSRPGGFDRGSSSNDRSSDRRPTGIGQSDRKPSGSSRAPESRGSSSGRSGGGSSRDREARRQ